MKPVGGDAFRLLFKKEIIIIIKIKKNRQHF